MRSYRGFMVVDQLVALVIIGVVAVASISVFQGIAYIRVKVAAINRMVEIEKRLLTSLQNGIATSDAINRLNSGGETPLQDFVLMAYDNTSVAVVGGVVRYDMDGQPCLDSFPGGPAANPSQDCGISVKVDIRCTAAALPGENAVCMTAYNIWSTSLSWLAQPLSSGPTPPYEDFTVNDYNFPIGYNHYLRNTVTNCLTAAEKGVFMTGFNRNTGESYCARATEDKCAENTFAVGLDFTASVGGGGIVRSRCQATQKLNCPDRYSLADFNAASLDARMGKTGRCVFIGQTTVPWQNPVSGTNAITTYPCPRFYRPVATSCVITSSSWPCGTSPRVVVSGNSVTCLATSSALACGAGWTAQLSMTGSCQLKTNETPEFLAVQ